MTKKLFIKTYGCQMNVYDSERMAEALGGSGYEQTDTPDDADMILLNTCHIREKAAEKIYSELGRYKPLKEAKPDLKIGVAGCVAQAEGAEIVARQPMVDLVVGPQAYHRLPELEAKAGKGKRALDTDFPEEDKFAHLKSRPKARRRPGRLLDGSGRLRQVLRLLCGALYPGAEVSRPVAQVLSEARDLVERGVREITLLGQNVNAYHGRAEAGTWGLARLIRELAKIDGLDRIRFTTSHPNDMEDDLIAAHGDCEKLMPYLHLPVQSGSDRILKAMARKHTAADYIRLIERLRAARPDLLLSGDFIVGFPGETEADFQDTLALVEEVRYGQAYSFKYSPRPGTPAAEKDSKMVPADVASDRLQRLQALLNRQQGEAQEAMVGRTTTVLFEKPGRLDGQLVGKSEYLQAVHVQAPRDLLGQIARVEIVEAAPNSLAGRLI